MFSSIEDGLDCGFDNYRTEFGKQPGQPTRAEMRRACHCRQIAAEFTGVADIQSEQVEQIVAEPAAFVEPDWRNAQSLLPYLGRGRIVAAMRSAADVALMRPDNGPEQAPLPVKNRNEGC